MKRIIIALIYGLIVFSTADCCLAAGSNTVVPVQVDVRDYDGIEVPAGTFIPVENAQEISTQYCQNGYKVTFVSTNDLYMHDTNIIPINTKFTGYVDEVHDPVIGTNASMKVRITKMILPDGFEMPVKGYLYTSNNNLIGGELTPPAEWIKMPHYQQRFDINGTLQIRPGRTRRMGSHAVVNAGEYRIIILTDSVEITHTLTN